MKRILFLLLLTACGGGGGNEVTTPAPQPPPQVATWDYRDYAPFKQSKVGEGNFGKWISEVKDSNAINISWPPSIEEFRIRELAGQLWVIIDAYSGTRPTDVRNTIRTTRAEYNEGAGWISLPPGPGNPYVPVLITKQITVRQWGWISGTCAQGGKPDEECGSNSVRYFWQHTITPNGPVVNVCWQGADNTRDTLMQQEAWWTNIDGWLDRSTAGTMKDGIPTGENINYTWHQTIAKGAGYLWTGSGNACLYR